MHWLQIIGFMALGVCAVSAIGFAISAWMMHCKEQWRPWPPLWREPARCRECGHSLMAHRHGTDKVCYSGQPAVNREGELVTFGAMDWCTCKKFAWR